MGDISSKIIKENRNTNNIKERLEKLVNNFNQGRYKELLKGSESLENYIKVYVLTLKCFLTVHFILFTYLCFIAGGLVVNKGSGWYILFIIGIFIINTFFICAMSNWFNEYCKMKKYLSIIINLKISVIELDKTSELLRGMLLLNDDLTGFNLQKINGKINEI